MDVGAQWSAWARGSQKQHPEQIWQNDGVLTDFQRWTVYRICTRTLNLYQGGWPENRHCTYQLCSTNKETIEHIVWECSRAQDVWQEWLPQWLGHYPHREELTSLIPHLASRTAPPASPNFVEVASQTIPYWEPGHDEALQVIWSIWTTCTQCTLWIIRNREIFEKETISGQEAKRRLMKLADFQTKAVIKGLASRPNTYELGFRVAECYAVFTAVVPSDRPIALMRRTLLVHSVNLPESSGRRGAWVIVGKTPEEVCWIGFQQEMLPVAEVDMAKRLITRALAQLKQEVLLATVQLRIQGAQHVLQALKEDMEAKTYFNEVVSTTWRSSHKTANKAVVALIKSKQLSRFTNQTLNRDCVPPSIWNCLQDWISLKTGKQQDPKAIRQRLQEYQDSIVHPVKSTI